VSQIRGVEFDAGEIPQKHPISLAGIPIPWQEISLAGSSYIFEGMFPLNKEIFFSSILSTVEQEKTKDISPKACMCQQLHLCLQQGNRFRLKILIPLKKMSLLF
jgi:hypothetical protein